MRRQVIHVPWYATGFRGDDLEAALVAISGVSLRYGARGWSVFRSKEDRYRMLQVLQFDTAPAFQRFWYGDEFQDMRSSCQSWYQVPVLYVFQELVGEGSMHPEEVPQT